MRQLTDVKDYIITAIILLLAITLMVNRHEGGLQNLRKVSITVLSYLEQPLSNFRIYRQAISTNTYLHRQNILLQDELNRLRSVEEQNRVLRDLLNLREESDLPLIPVRVVAKDLVSINSSITVNAGTDDGVKIGMPVINSDGLIGQVIIVAKDYSQVLPYSNSMFRVSAQIEENRAYGIVSWPARSNRELLLRFIPETVQVEPGQYVYTSGYSNQFPAGIPVGEVTEIESGAGIETQTIYLEAFADLSTIAEAFIIEFEPDTTIQNLNEAQEELF
ncbi:rod shape-determining protein MreC [Rhodohalobacter sulfatireducens]|uniref:Cell shape-determining protein MreC n=1 Tax=Rhodohalobacter sulfatireducens TaxID=2911366 RepID=A0ABS9KE74_9BACT|nr:rod shape-determining protein MreC [Rhodohalobacter sulfatireducens]MCG2589159.1 rod shape-determining protein MreC [Rhodohalobacter sulfatireducens]